MMYLLPGFIHTEYPAEENYFNCRENNEAKQLLPVVLGSTTIYRSIDHFFVPPVAAFIYSDQGRFESAAETLGAALGLYLEGTGWLKKWVAFHRLQEDIRAQLGDAVYDRAFARDADLNIETLVSELMNEFGTDE